MIIKNKKILIAGIITIILLIAFIGIMFKMINENNQCLDDPFKYSAEKLKESGGNYVCGCNSLDTELLDFSFSEEGIKIIKPVVYKDIDFSNLNYIEVEGGLEK